MKINEIQGKMKVWVEAINAGKIASVADELEKTLGSDKTIEETKLNKSIFNLLLHLVHFASKSDRSDTRKGQEIWRLSNWICRRMTEINDDKKFFQSIYHISSCLFDMKMYTEGIEMCKYILPTNNLWKTIKPLNLENMYLKISCLLHDVCSKLIKTLQFAQKNNNYKILLSTMECEFDMTLLAHSNRWRYVLTKMNSYREKISAIADKSGVDCQIYEKKLTDFTLSYMVVIKLGDKNDAENNENTYRLMFTVINRIILRDISKRRFKSMDGIMVYPCIEIFSRSLHKHQSYQDCFDLYVRLTKILVKPIEYLTLQPYDEHAINRCSAELLNFSGEHRYDVAIKWYSYAVLELFTELLDYWVEYLRKNPTKGAQYITDSLIHSIMCYVDIQSPMFSGYVRTDCRCDTERVSKKSEEDTKKCRVINDLYNDITLKSKVLSVLSRSLNNDKNRTIHTLICDSAIQFTNSNLAGIEELKQSNCKHWSYLWTLSGAVSYNIAVFCELKYHTSSIQLYSSLCMYLVRLEGLKRSVVGPNLLPLVSPLPTLLHRLTSVHTSNGNYEEAMIVCSLNALVGCNKPIKEQTKIYNSWITIKKKFPSSRDTTMIECLRSNKSEIDKIIEDFNVDNYDTIEFCRREIICLSNNISNIDLSSPIISLVDEIKRFKCSNEIYAQCVQSLGYYWLNKSKTNLNISNYLRNVSNEYKRETKPSVNFHMSYGHIKFYVFYQRIREISDKTEQEIASVESAIRSRQKENNGNQNSLTDPSNLVPLYSTIDKTIMTEITTLLERSLRAWKISIDLLEASEKGKTNDDDWLINQTLELIMIAGEYSRLYNLHNLETEAWRLSRILARRQNDNIAIIYTAMRNLTSQCIYEKWIEEADKSVEILQDSQDNKVQIAIAGYLLTLADVYYENDKAELAGQLYDRATKKFRAVFMADPANFLLVIQLRMNQLNPETNNPEENYQSAYTRIIVEGIYTMLAIDDPTETTAFSLSRIKRLYNNDTLTEYTNNLAPRMNALLGYREISAHLMRRLSNAQKSGATICVAECLKSLCYMDLTRAKFDDCEVKLQALEHILEIDAIDLTMKSEQLNQPIHSTTSTNNSESTSNNIESSSHHMEAVRDLGINDTSPILRMKIFKNPDFLVHDDSCSCHKCSNNRYRSLVFAATHLRAQLYSLRRNEAAAQQHFEGALIIKKNILKRRKTIQGLKSYRHLDAVEFVTFHLDYCRFLKWSMPKYLDYAADIAQSALNLCEDYNLQNHPVYMSTNLLIYEFRFDSIYTDPSQFSKFTVPPIEDIDISQYIKNPTVDPSDCVTPLREIVAQQNPISVRRKKAAPFNKLEKVPIDLTEEEPAICTSPPAPSRIRPLRRRRNIVETSDDSEIDNKPKKSIVPIIELTSPDDDEKTKEDKKVVVSKEKTSSTEKISQRGSSRSKSNNQLDEKSSVPVPSVNINEITDMVEKMTVKKTTNRKSKNVQTKTAVREDAVSEVCQPTENKGTRSSARLSKKNQ